MLERFSLLTKLGWNLCKGCTISFLYGFLCQTAARSLYRECARTCLYSPLPEIQIQQNCSYMHKSRKIKIRLRPHQKTLLRSSIETFDLLGLISTVACVKFTFANKIEAVYESSHVSAKVEPRST